MSKHAWLTPDSHPVGLTCYRLYCPTGEEFESALRGAIAPLAHVWNWEQSGALTPEETADYFADANIETMKWRRCVHVGTVFWFTGQTAPTGSLDCNGATYQQTAYPDLFAVIGTVFGASGVGTFRVPHISRRVIVGCDDTLGVPLRQVGDIGGAEDVTLAESELPAHAHSMPDHTHTIDPHNHTTHSHTGIVVVAPGEAPVQSPGFANWLTSSKGLTTNAGGSGDTGDAGGGDAHENMPPFIVLRPCIQAV